MKEASYYNPVSEKKVQCLLCPHHCVIREDHHGICLTRENIGGTLISANYLRPVSVATDPIEKKPLFHFHPGAAIFSTGPNGCTFKCSFCQNHDISQGIINTRELRLNEFISLILKSNTIGIAYTYSEPYIWFETIMDVGPAVKEHGLVNVMVTNGYMEPGPLSELVKVVDAMNIDVKSMNPEFYRTLCKAELEPVLRTCETVRKHCHLEITNLLITGENDSEEEVKRLTRYIAQNLGKDTPLHLSRYFPRYKMSNEPTPATTLMRAWEIAKEELDFVYVGNIDAEDKSHTRCPSCSTMLVQRHGYDVRMEKTLINDTDTAVRCGKCDKLLNIIL